MGFYSSLCSAHLEQALIGSAVNEKGRQYGGGGDTELWDPRLALSNKI